MVDDLVGAELDLLSIGEITGLAVGPHTVTNDRGVGGRRQLDVVLGDAANTSMHEADLDLVTFQLAQRLGEGFERAVDVGLDDQVQRGSLAALDLIEDVLEPGAAGEGVSLAAE